MNQTNWTYLAQLARALQMEGVEGHRSGEFIAEIDSHLAETGVDPVEEFGTPYELAAELAVRPGARRPGWVPPLWLMWLLSAVASMIAVVAVDAVMLGWEDGRVPIRARGIVWIAVFMASSLSFRLLRHPTSRREELAAPQRRRRRTHHLWNRSSRYHGQPNGGGPRHCDGAGSRFLGHSRDCAPTADRGDCPAQQPDSLSRPRCSPATTPTGDSRGKAAVRGLTAASAGSARSDGAQIVYSERLRCRPGLCPPRCC